MTDIFREVRERVSAQDAARRYGVQFDRRGWAVCPFHRDKHPSMSFRNGRYHCWVCDIQGDSIDFTGRLLGLEPMAAVERLNADFALDLPLHRKPTPAETQAAQHRREVSETYQLFQQWRDGLIQKLNACFREGHLALKSLEAPADFDRLTDAQALAIQEQARFEYLADVLTNGTMEDVMQIFRERGRVEQLCEKILKSTPPKLKAA